MGNLGEGTAKFVDDEGFSATLDSLRALVVANCFDPWSTALSEFKAGNFAMLPQGAWNIGNFRGDETLDFVFGPVPTPSGTGVAADLFGVGWAVSSASENQEAAKTFVEFFTRGCPADPARCRVRLFALRRRRQWHARTRCRL